MNLLIAILGSLLSALIWAGVIVFGEPLLLQNLVAPAAGVDIQGWLDEFLKSQTFALAIGSIVALSWHVTASRGSGRYDDRRIWWIIAWMVCILSSIFLCAWLLPDTQEGVAWAYALSFLNGLVPFWLGTVWCTPGTCKYAPLGAGRMRGLFSL